MGLLALLMLLCGGALVSKVTWPQAIEADSIVSHDGHFLSVGQTIEYFAPIQKVLGCLHTTQYSSTLAVYDGLVMAVLSGGVLDVFFLPTGPHSPSL